MSDANNDKTAEADVQIEVPLLDIDYSTVSTVPAYEELLELPLDDLLDCRRVFESADDALSWHEANGEKVATKGFEPIMRLLKATSSERRERGVMMLERAVKAQVAYKQCFKIFAPTKRQDILKTIVAAVRDSNVGEKDHLDAIKEFRKELRIASEALAQHEEQHRQQRDALVKRIEAHLAEELFIAWIREGNRLYDNREKCTGDREWSIKALDAVESGHPEKVRTSALKGLLHSLDYWSSRYFLEDERPSNRETSGQRKRRDQHRAKRHQNRRPKTEGEE